MTRLALCRRVVQMNQGKVKRKHHFLVAYSQVFVSTFFFFQRGADLVAAARLCVYIKNGCGALICISLLFYLYSTFPQSRRAAVSMAPLGWLSSPNLTGRYLLLLFFPPLFLPPAVTGPPAGPVCSVLHRGRTEPQTGEFTLLVHNVDQSVACCGEHSSVGSSLLDCSCHFANTGLTRLEQKSILESVPGDFGRSVFPCRKGALFCESSIPFWSAKEDSEDGLQRKTSFLHQTK